MRFQRNIDPKDAMGIGRDAQMKKLFLQCIKDMNVVGIDPALYEGKLKWLLWTKGIELHNIVAENVFPEDYKYRFYYKDCNGEEAHIMRDITLTSREIIA